MVAKEKNQVINKGNPYLLQRAFKSFKIKMKNLDPLPAPPKHFTR
jgi:hypothetical protein